MNRTKEITKKLRRADPGLSAYVVELEKENLRLQKQVAKLQVESVSKNNEIKALKQLPPKIKVRVVDYASRGKDNA
jgi:hypothetical protein